MKQIARNQLDKLNETLAGATGGNDSLLGGELGLIYYYSQLYKVTEEIGYKEKVEGLLARVFANINSGYPQLIGTSFNAGGAGLGYVVNALSAEGFISFDLEKEFAELDRFLYTTAVCQIEDDFIDFLHGALGTVHYFTQRASSPLVDRYLDELIDKLCRRVNKTDGGYWFSNYVISLEDKENINFGLSHGQCGFLLLLINAWHRSSHKALIEKIVMEGIRFIRKYKMDVDFSNDEYSSFPFVVKREAREITAPNRLGWCYGDLNQVLLFYRAGRLFKNPALIDLADVIGGQTLLRRTEKATLVSDSSFCHGAAGLAEIYHRLYSERQLPIYRDGHEYWVEQTIILLEKDLERGRYAGKEHALLDGLVGVAFSLLSYVASYDLVWSKCLLL
jgi:lantibiotic modifying enzyme